VQAFNAELSRRGSTNKRAVLDSLVRRELLLAEAQRTGFDRSPEVRQAWRSFVIDRFAEQHRKQIEELAPPTPAEVEAFYQTHLARYSTPERLHLALIYLRQPSVMEPNRKEELVQRANAARQAAIADSTTTPDFGALAGKYSDHRPSLSTGGDIGWVTSTGSNGAWPSEVMAGIQALHQVGDISPVIATAQGLYLVKLIERTSGETSPLEKVRDRVQFQLAREQADNAETGFYSKLERSYPVEINTARFDEIRPAANFAASAPPRLPAR
jgi:hypothetical protein